MTVRIGADVGAPSPASCWSSRAGSARAAHSRHRAPEVAVLDAIDALVDGAGAVPGRHRPSGPRDHVGTSTLIGTPGGPPAFVTTAGFRDVVETGTESR
ncbi:MAG: hypothetical protein R2695_10135 [Acidimicrobiales bacterium]